MPGSGLMFAALFFLLTACIDLYAMHHHSPEDIMSLFTLHFKRFVWNLLVCVCVCVREVLNDPTSTLFQVDLRHGHICSQGHKFADRETSGAAGLLRLHCYCT